MRSGLMDSDFEPKVRCLDALPDRPSKPIAHRLFIRKDACVMLPWCETEENPCGIVPLGLDRPMAGP